MKFKKQTLCEAVEGHPKVIIWDTETEEDRIFEIVSKSIVWSDEFVMQAGSIADELTLNDESATRPMAVIGDPLIIQPFSIAFYATSVERKEEFTQKVKEMIDDPNTEVFITVEEQLKRGEEFQKNIVKKNLSKK